MHTPSKVVPGDVCLIILRRPWATPLQALLKGCVLEPPPPLPQLRAVFARQGNKTNSVGVLKYT